MRSKQPPFVHSHTRSRSVPRPNPSASERICSLSSRNSTWLRMATPAASSADVLICGCADTRTTLPVPSNGSEGSSAGRRGPAPHPATTEQRPHARACRRRLASRIPPLPRGQEPAFPATLGGASPPAGSFPYLLLPPPGRPGLQEQRKGGHANIERKRTGPAGYCDLEH